MQVSAWIRKVLWRSDRWCAELDQLRRSVAADPQTTKTIQRTVDLAQATEYLDPDRSHALALYLSAWRAGHTLSRERVWALARELRAYVTLAELALAEHAEAGDPASLVAAGRAFFDGGLIERATAIFVRATEQHASLASAVAESTDLADVRTVLALSRFAQIEPEREIAACLERARKATDGAGAIYMHAARIARAAKLESSSAQIIHAAARRCPADEDVMRLVEDWFLERGRHDEILDYYGLRFAAAQGQPAWVESVRAAACELVVRNVQPGLGLRLLRSSLEHAYAAQLPTIVRHLASWELLVVHARSSQATIDLTGLIADGLRAPLLDDDALYLSRLGLEITWRDAGDPVAAQPYAAAVLERVPEQPLAAAFIAERFPEWEPPPPAVEPVVVVAEPVLPTVTFKSAAPSPAAPGPSAAPSPPAAEPRRHGATSIPPQLKRDVSPIPKPPAPRKDAAPRAARKVVPVDVVVELPTGAFFSAVLRDLSISGAFIPTKRSLEVGIVVTLEVQVPAATRLAQSSHRIEARIARRTGLGLGLAFVAPPPEFVRAIAALIGS
ncbi:MAG: PilZ domain-containing protein [Myxococcales bacterium]|nr:PilZ domain-containing protein [Myxococcales bacterium]